MIYKNTKRQIRQKDLVPIFKTESIISEVLTGKRQLTMGYIQELAQFFQLSPAVFLPQKKSNLAICQKKLVNKHRIKASLHSTTAP